jgi:hypothetical protein
MVAAGLPKGETCARKGADPGELYVYNVPQRGQKELLCVGKSPEGEARKYDISGGVLNGINDI